MQAMHACSILEVAFVCGVSIPFIIDCCARADVTTEPVMLPGLPYRTPGWPPAAEGEREGGSGGWVDQSKEQWQKFSFVGYLMIKQHANVS